VLTADAVEALVGALPPLAGKEVAEIRHGLLLAQLPRPPIGQSPHTVVHRQDKLALRAYGGAKHRTPVVVVPSLINQAAICDLEPDRSLVAALASAGWPTYLVDWGTPGPEDASEDVAYVVLELLDRALRRAARHAGSERVFVLGYCQGGTLATMLAALRPDVVAGLVTLNAPVQFAQGGRFRTLVQHLDVDAAIDGDGLLPVDVMKAAFKLLDPVGNVTKYRAIARASAHPRQLTRTLARERWLDENVPMPGAFARELIGRGYQDDALVDGSWELRGERVDLGAIRCPVHVVAAERDFISPAPSCTALADHVGGPAQVSVLPTGHIGVVVGSAGPRIFYPLLDTTFRAWSTS